MENKLIYEGNEYELGEVTSNGFMFHHLDGIPFPMNGKQHPNDPSTYIYLSIPINGKFYGFKLIDKLKPVENNENEYVKQLLDPELWKKAWEYPLIEMTVEKWNLMHPEDEIPRFLGIDHQFISQRYIPFPTEKLITGDTIVNEDNIALQYIKEYESFVLFDEERSAYIGNPFKTWRLLTHD